MKRLMHPLAAALSLVVLDAHAKIVLQPPPEVVAGLHARDVREMNALRGALLEQYSAAQSMIHSQQAKCRSVTAGSAQVGECRADAQQVKRAVREYRANLSAFRMKAAESVAWAKATAKLSATTSLEANHSARPRVIESSSDFRLVTPDGKTLPNEATARPPDEQGLQFHTGPGGGATLMLADGTLNRLGPNTTLAPIALGPKPPASGVPTMELVRGTLRWFHEAAVELNREINKPRHSLRVVQANVSVRGTEFDCTVLADGSGTLKLYSGTVLVAAKTGALVTLKPGEMIRIEDGKLGPVTSFLEAAP